MATGGKSREGEADDSVGKLTCPICLEKFRRPKLLPCFHSFCQSCLQGVVGSSPSFPCPSCRAVVLLPPGGVKAIQTNFYIEDDSPSSSPPQRLCDVCADDREATHSCLQCQQRYCLPCRQYHDAFPPCRGHTVVSLTEEGEEGCGKGGVLPQKPTAHPCPRHPDQPLLLHCTTCKVSLCLQCKLTLHEGHPTQDLADASSKVKDKLRDRLTSLTQELRDIDHTVAACKERCSKLQEQQRAAEEGFRARADTLHQWVTQSLEEAVSSLQSCSEQRVRPWQQHAQQLGNRKLALQAQQGHILRLLKEGQEADLLSLEAQLSSAPEEDVSTTQLKTQLTKDLPTLPVDYNPTAVNPVQLRAFLGVLGPLQQTSAGEGSVTPLGPTGVQGLGSAAASGKGSDGMDRGHRLPSAPSVLNKGIKQPPTQFFYSKNPESSVRAMCPISQKRLWVLYTPSINSSYYLKLFDAEGQVLTTVENQSYNVRLVTITDDIILSWSFNNSSVELVTADGSVSTCDVGSPVDGILSSAKNDIHYMNKQNEKRLCGVSFVSQCQSVNTAVHSSDSPSAFPVTPALKEQLTPSVTEVVFDQTPEGFPPHASAEGRYFVFIVKGQVRVYSRAGSRRSALTCSYQPKDGARDARFCLIDGQEMLLVTVYNDNKVHVIDHTDGGRFVRYLDTGPLNLDKPQRLATDYDKHVWIGCGGGKVVVIDL